MIRLLNGLSEKQKDELPFNPNVKPVVLSYQFQDSNDVETKIFEIDKEYFQFVYKNRLKLDAKAGINFHNFSAVFGPVLDGQVTRLKVTLDDYFKGVNSLEKTADILWENIRVIHNFVYVIKKLQINSNL